LISTNQGTDFHSWGGSGPGDRARTKTHKKKLGEEKREFPELKITKEGPHGVGGGGGLEQELHGSKGEMFQNAKTETLRAKGNLKSEEIKNPHRGPLSSVVGNGEERGRRPSASREGSKETVLP